MMIARGICAGLLIVAALALVPAQSPGPRVELSLIVTDKDNKSINTIRKEEVHVFEGNVEQAIISVTPDARPIDMVLAIDASGSVRPWFQAVSMSAAIIIRNAQPEDEIFIEKFISSDKIETLHEFSRDGKSLLKAVSGLYLEGGQSAIIDALYLAAEALDKHNQEQAGRRKVVVVITDGEDRNSYYTAEKVVNFQRTHDVQVFALGFTTGLKSTAPSGRQSPRERAEKLLKAIASESGGRAFFATSPDDLVLNAVPALLSQLHRQFVISYQSSDDSGKQGFRPVTVKLDSTDAENRTVITPHAYYFPLANTTPPAKKEKSQ